MTPTLSPLKALEESMRTSAECTDSPVAHGVLVRYADKLSTIRETVEQEMARLRQRLEEITGYCAEANRLLVESDERNESLRAQLAERNAENDVWQKAVEALSLDCGRAYGMGTDMPTTGIAPTIRLLVQERQEAYERKAAAEAEVERLRHVVSEAATAIGMLPDPVAPIMTLCREALLAALAPSTSERR